MLILSGVLQGCALSGSIFVISLGPFLRYAEQLLSGSTHNTLRACADDLGAVLAHFTTLRQLYQLFCLLAAFTNLHLNLTKCHIAPLVPLTQQQVNRLKVWLLEVLPQWSAMDIATSAEYLGTWIGPAADDHWWTKAT